MISRLTQKFPLCGFLVGLLGIALLFHNLIGKDLENFIWADDFDPLLLKWIFEWGYHSLIILNDPANFFNANSFFPHTNTLAYSDSLLSAQLIYSPLRVMGISSIKAIYLTLAVFTLFGAVMTDYMLKRVGEFSAIERAFIIFSAHFSLCFTSFLGHYQLFGFHMLPSTILAVFVVCRDYRKTDMILMLILFSIGVTFSIYMAPMFLMVLVCLLPYFYVKFFLKNSFIFNPPRNLAFLFSASLLFGLLLYFIYFYPYIELSKEFPPQPYSETAVYSAKLSSLFKGFSINSYFHMPAGGGYSNNGDWERAIFPGFILLFFSIFGVWFLTFKGFYKNEFLSKVSASQEIYYYSLGVLFIAYMLSLGPYGPHEIRLPFYYLSKIYSGFRSIRAPGRFGLFMGLPLGILAVFGIRSLLEGSISKNFVKHALVFFLTILIIESTPRFKVLPIPYNDISPYLQITPFIKPGSVVVDLPVAGSGHIDTLKRVMAQLNNSFIYEGKLIVGYGGKTTNEHDELIALDGMIQHHGSDFLDILNLARRLGVNYLIIRKKEYSESLLHGIERSIDNFPKKKLLFNSADIILIEI